jgi:hypothetical protein
LLVWYKSVYFDKTYNLKKRNMKKLPLLIVISFASVSLFAQKFGVRAGLNFANVNIKTQGLSISPSATTGLNAGIFVNFPVAANVSIQPELAYSSMGFKISGAGIDTAGTATTNYLVLPVLVKFKVPATGLGIYAGPQYGILLNAKGTSGSTTTDIKDSYKSGDFSAVVGLEYELPFGLFASARYQAGLSNVAKNAQIDESLKNTSFTILVGFRFK